MEKRWKKSSPISLSLFVKTPGLCISGTHCGLPSIPFFPPVRAKICFLLSSQWGRGGPLAPVYQWLSYGHNLVNLTSSLIRAAPCHQCCSQPIMTQGNYFHQSKTDGHLKAHLTGKRKLSDLQNLQSITVQWKPPNLGISIFQINEMIKCSVTVTNVSCLLGLIHNLKTHWALSQSWKEKNWPFGDIWFSQNSDKKQCISAWQEIKCVAQREYACGCLLNWLLNKIKPRLKTCESSFPELKHVWRKLRL